MVRKVLSFLLAALLCLGTMACCAEGAPEPYQYFKYEEPIELSTHISISTSNVFVDDDSVENNGLTRWYEKELGIKWTLDWVAGDGDTNSQKLDLAFASDDLPDVITPSLTQLGKYVEAGKILPLDDLIEEYASPLTKWALQDATDNTNGAFFAPVTIGGKIYAIPQMSDSLAWWTNNFLRTDILAEMDCELPTTLDELEAIFDKYIEMYPGHYPVVMDNNLLGQHNVFQTLLTSNNAYVDMWEEDEEGNLVYTSIQPEMKAALERMASWYEKGYIDPEFAVYDGAKRNEIISAGDWLFTHDYWYRIATFCNTWKNVEGSDITAVPYLPGPDGTWSIMKNAWYTSIVAITTNCEHPEAAIYALNAFWDSYYRNDVELREILADQGYEFHFPVTEEQEAWNIEQVAKDNPNVAEPKLLWKYNYDEELEGPGFLNDFYTHGNVHYGFYGRLSSRANNDYATISAAVKAGMDQSLLTEEAKKTWEGWYLSHPKMLTTFATSYDIWKDLDFKVNAFTSSSTPTMIEKKSYLDKLQLEYFTNIIMGTKSIDAFDQFVDEWTKNGGEQITQEVNEWYASTK